MSDVNRKLIPQGFRYGAEGSLTDKFVVRDANCNGSVNKLRHQLLRGHRVGR